MTKQIFYELLESKKLEGITPFIIVGGYYGSFAVSLTNIKYVDSVLYVPQYRYDVSKNSQGPTIIRCRELCNKNRDKYKKWLEEWLGDKESS